MLLEINTTGQEAEIRLFDTQDNVISSAIWKIIHNHTEELLLAIERVILKAGKKKSDLSAIKVNPGPGPYTGVRVGVTVANLLGFSLNIPVLTEGLDTKPKIFKKPAIPVYAFAPKISQSKS